jgi:hypothetical protein
MKSDDSQKCCEVNCNEAPYCKGLCERHYNKAKRRRHRADPVKHTKELERRRELKKQNKEKELAKHKKYVADNKEKILAYQRNWRAKNRLKIREREKLPSQQYSHLIQCAKRRNIPLQISREEYIQWRQTHTTCTYCASPLEKTGYCADRVDSSKPYLLSNITPCCRKCNVAKSNLPLEEFLNHIAKIYENLKSKVS